MIEQAVFLYGCDDSAQDADHPCHRRRRQRQPHGVGEGRGDQLGDAAVERVACAEIAAQRAGEIPPELHGHGLIESQLARHPLDGFGVDMLAHHRGDGVAGHDAQHDENQKRHADEHHQRLQDSCENVLCHGFPL